MKAHSYFLLVSLALAGAPLRAQRSRAPDGALAERLLRHLGLGPGAAVADVGAGNGAMAWDFARAVGTRGTVWLEEIDVKFRARWERERPAELTQCRFAIGTERDPKLPPASLDLVFLRRVFHHFRYPRDMLARLREALKPGGHLVVLDGHRGPLRDRAPLAERGAHHHWSAETTLARLAGEAGLVYAGDLTAVVRAREGFALAFRRPRQEEAGETLAPLPPRIPLERLAGEGTHAVLAVALPPSRAVLRAALDRMPGRIAVIELGLDEWLLPGEDLPLPSAPAHPWRALRCRGGVPVRPLPPIDLAVFHDAFHRLYYEDVLLGVIRSALRPQASLVIVDRVLEVPLPRLAEGHRRGIDLARARSSLARNGFALREEVREAGWVYLRAVRAEDARVSPAPPEAGLAAAIEALAGEKRRRAAVMGDDPIVRPAALADCGFERVWHSTARGWEGYEGDATADLARAERGPYPRLPERTRFDLVVVTDYAHHPEARILVGEAPAYLEGGGRLVLIAEGARADGLLEGPKEIRAFQPALRLVATCAGERLGRPGASVWVFENTARGRRRGPRRR